jgi:ankyrin repeat protein
MTEKEFQQCLKSSVQLGSLDDLRKFIAAGAAAGHSVNMLLPAPKPRLRNSSALHYAATLAELGALEVLIECGGDVNSRDSGGWTPLHCALGYSESSDRRNQVVEALLRHGAQPNAVTLKNETPLHLLMAIHSDRDWKNAMGNKAGAVGSLQAMRDAVAGDLLPLTRMLIAAGADPDFVPEGVRNSYRTPFQLAIMNAIVSQVRLMVEEFGVSVLQRTLSKKSMLSLAGSSKTQALLHSCMTTETVAKSTSGGGDQPVTSTMSRSAPAL